MVRPAARFIAQRPEQHGGMILVTQHHTGGTLHIGMQPERIIAQIVPDAMGFEVGFIDQIDPIFIAQLVPERVIGIMAGANRVEVELLHQLDLGAHIVFCERPTAFGMMLMTIYAAQHEAFAVQQNDAILDLHLAETHATAFEIHGLFPAGL